MGPPRRSRPRGIFGGSLLPGRLPCDLRHHGSLWQSDSHISLHIALDAENVLCIDPATRSVSTFGAVGTPPETRNNEQDTIARLTKTMEELEYAVL